MPSPQDYDLAREQSPNPAWLRSQASNLKLEAQVLEGHLGEELVDRVMAAGPGRAVISAFDIAVKATQAHALLCVTSEALLALAAALESPRVEVVGDPRGEADR